MSKAFDTINRKTLVEELSEVLNEDELHLITIPFECEVSSKELNQL